MKFLHRYFKTDEFIYILSDLQLGCVPSNVYDLVGKLLVEVTVLENDILMQVDRIVKGFQASVAYQRCLAMDVKPRGDHGFGLVQNHVGVKRAARHQVLTVLAEKRIVNLIPKRMNVVAQPCNIDTKAPHSCQGF